MQITLNIPESFAERITQLAQQNNVTPTQWITRAVVQATADKAPRVGRPKINASRDAEMRAKWAAGATHSELSKEYGVHRVRVVQICNGRDRFV